MIATCPTRPRPAPTDPAESRRGYVDHYLFHLPAAGRRIAALDPGPETSTDDAECVGGSVALARLCRRRPLGKRREQYLFCRMNYEKFLAAGCEDRPAERPGDRPTRRSRDEHLRRAAALRNEIVEANMRLAVKEAARVTEGVEALEELVADAIAPLIRAVELFDVSRGYSFSTYATHTLRNHFRRHGRRAARRHRTSIPGDARLLHEIPDDRIDPKEESRRVAECHRRAAALLARLSPRERHILSERFGLDGGGRPRTFQEIGTSVGLSKERVRIIAHEALDRLREEAAAEGWELPL